MMKKIKGVYMNLVEFNNQYGNLKDVDKIEVDPLCDHPQHQKINKSISRGAAKRNILKHGGKEFICRECDMRHNNPMNKVGQGRRQTNTEITVSCPVCHKTRNMKQSCYYGVMQSPYIQKCGTCAQLGKTISEDQKKAISEKLTGRQLSEGHVEKIRNYMKNNPEGIDRAKKNIAPYYGQTAGWNKGLEMPEEVKAKISESNTGKERTEEQCQHIAEGRKAMLAAQGGLLPETKEKLSRATLEQFKRGFEPTMHHRHGKYFSKKINKELFYKSSYELKAFMTLDNDPLIVSYEYEPLAIEYIKPGNDYKSNYLIDFRITYSSGKINLMEVKPKKRTYGDVERAKSQAAIAYCKENGYDFELWTEEKLFSSEKEMRAFVEAL